MKHLTYFLGATAPALPERFGGKWLWPNAKAVIIRCEWLDLRFPI